MVRLVILRPGRTAGTLDRYWRYGSPEAVLQFFILHPNHHGASHDRQYSQHPADCQTCAYALGQHLAEMSKIYGMAHVGANARCYQTLMVVAGRHFRQSTQLGEAELTVRGLVERKACAK